MASNLPPVRIAVVGASEMALVADDVAAAFLKRGYTGANKPLVAVYNYAVTGMTIEEYHNPAKRPWLLRPYPPINDNALTKMDALLMFFGGNDMLLQRDPKLIEKDICAMIDRCCKCNTKVILIGLEAKDLESLVKSVNFRPGYTQEIEAMFTRLKNYPGVAAYYPSLYAGLKPEDFLGANMDRRQRGAKILGNAALGETWEFLKHSKAGWRPKELTLEALDISKGRRQVHANPNGQQKLGEYFVGFMEPVIHGIMNEKGLKMGPGTSVLNRMAEGTVASRPANEIKPG